MGKVQEKEVQERVLKREVLKKVIVNNKYMKKEWYLSKTLWVNVIAIVAIIIQSYTSFIIDPATQASILVLINIILRAVTGEEVTFGGRTIKERLSK